MKTICTIFSIVGFHLSGTVKETHGICLQRKVCCYKSSIKFDRCKITSITCTCSNKTILWCSHAVALAVYRIRYADRVRIRLPVSETILQLKTQELQSLLLHLITKHHDLLPSVQNLIDDFKRPDSEVSVAVGVPDPTAGACAGVDSLWYFDDTLIRSEVKAGLEPNNTGKNISSLFIKVSNIATNFPFETKPIKAIAHTTQETLGTRWCYFLFGFRLVALESRAQLKLIMRLTLSHQHHPESIVVSK